jgi:hypothetical protein
MEKPLFFMYNRIVDIKNIVDGSIYYYILLGALISISNGLIDNITPKLNK